jgi:hypothetical protein
MRRIPACGSKETVSNGTQTPEACCGQMIAMGGGSAEVIKAAFACSPCSVNCTMADHLRTANTYVTYAAGVTAFGWNTSDINQSKRIEQIGGTTGNLAAVLFALH